MEFRVIQIVGGKSVVQMINRRRTKDRVCC